MKLTETFTFFADLSAKHNAPLTINLTDNTLNFNLSCIEYDYITIDVNIRVIDEIFTGSVEILDDAKKQIDYNEFNNVGGLVQFINDEFNNVDDLNQFATAFFN
jgi:hypothetical protein